MTSRSLRQLLTRPEHATSGNGSTLIDRYTDRDDHATTLHYLIPGKMLPQDDLHLSLIDSSYISNSPMPVEPNRSAIWHVIWVEDESRATATGIAETETLSWPIAPGDSLNIPPGASLRTTSGQLGVLVTLPAIGQGARLSEPTHGTDEFVGFNRRTAYSVHGNIATCRWKVTQPLNLALHLDGPVIVLSLAGDPAIATPSESLTLRRGQAVVADLQHETTIYPDGLGYIFIIGVGT